MLRVHPTSNYIRVRDFRMHYTDWGDNGAPLILYHGGQRTGRSWDAVARRLQDGFHVFAIDGRGHGDSEWTPRGYHINDRAKDLIAFIEALRLPEVVLAGHSVGGTVGILAALERPDLFASLVLVDATLAADRERSMRRTRQQTHVRRYFRSREEYAALLRVHRETRHWTPEVQADVVAHEIVEHPSGQVETKWAPRTFNVEERGHDEYELYSSLPRLPMPVLLMLARGHTEEEVARVRDAVRAMPQGKLVLFPEAGHNIYMEQPEAVVALIRDFLAGRTLPDVIRGESSFTSPEP